MTNDSKASVDFLTMLPPEIWGKILTMLHHSPSRSLRERPFKDIALVCTSFKQLAEHLRFSSYSWSAQRQDTATLFNDSLDFDQRRLKYVRIAHWDAMYMEMHEDDGSETTAFKPPKFKTVPDFVLDKLPMLSQLRTLHVWHVPMTPIVLKALLQCESLKELDLQHVEIPSGLHVARKERNKSKLRLTSLHISYPGFGDDYQNPAGLVALAKSVASPSLKSLEFQSWPVPSLLFKVLSAPMPPTQLQSLVISVKSIDYDAKVLRDILVAHEGLRTLRICDGKVKIRIPASSLPLLESYEGPREMLEMFVVGRPVESVSLARWNPRLFMPPEETDLDNDLPDELLPAVLQAATRGSILLRSLSVALDSFDESLSDTITTLFPHLHVLEIKSTERISETLLETHFASHLSRLQACRTLTLENQAQSLWEVTPYLLPAEQLSELAHKQQREVLLFDRNCPTLRQIKLGGIEWVWMSVGEWKGYSGGDAPLDLNGLDAGKPTQSHDDFNNMLRSMGLMFAPNVEDNVEERETLAPNAQDTVEAQETAAH